MHLLKTNFEANPNIGLYAYVTDKYCLLGIHLPKKKIDQIKKVLKVPVHIVSICGTSLIGVFCAGNENCLLIPELAFEEELKVLDKLKIKYKTIKTKHTALGNNILANENGCLVSTEFSAVAKKTIRQALDVPLRPGEIADHPTVGSSAVLNKKACLINRDIYEEELKYVEDILKIKCHPGTVNMGNPYVKTGLLANSHGFIIGALSGGPEIAHIDEVLGFL